MTKHEYICRVAEVVRLKSDCFKRKVGAVFVNDDYEILATGYNAPPRRFHHCDYQVKYPENLSGGTCGAPCTRNIHAEQNAIVQAAKRGTALRGSTLYCTYCPCVDCSRLLINLGVRAVHIQLEDSDRSGWNTLLQSDVQMVFGSWRL